VSRVAIALTALLLSACGAAPVSMTAPSERDPVRAGVERLLARRSVAELASLDLAAREEAIFGALYNELDRPKPRTLTDEAYAASLQRDERARAEGVWHVRWGRQGTADLHADATRFYFDVVPAFVGTLADELTAALDARGVARYSFKVVRSLEHIDIPVAAVLYVEGADLTAGRDAALAFARAHPDALWPEEAPFTRVLLPGLSEAHELGNVGPPGVAGNSFGGAMAHLLARALEGGPTDIGASELTERMRAELTRAGFDPAAPWQRPRPP
jgi:hypothetical protein